MLTTTSMEDHAKTHQKRQQFAGDYGYVWQIVEYILQSFFQNQYISNASIYIHPGQLSPVCMQRFWRDSVHQIIKSLSH